MKTKLTAILIAATLISLAHADEQSADYKRFEAWLRQVRMEAVHEGLLILPTDAEFFYLYCWQSDDHSITHAIQKAKQVW